MTSGVLLVFVMQHAAARSACTLGAYHAKGRGPGRRAAASASGASASGERGSGTAEGGGLLCRFRSVSCMIAGGLFKTAMLRDRVFETLVRNYL